MTKHETLVELLRSRAETHSKRAYRFLGDGVNVSESMSFADLDASARAIAVALRAAGLELGARALLLYMPDLDFVRAFFGCLYAGVTPVPVPAPNPARLARTLPRLRKIAGDADIAIVLTSAELQQAAAAMLPMAPELASPPWLATDTSTADPKAWAPPPSTGETPALLQYTSGSTGDPRGVTITHANLMHNLSLITSAMGDHDGGVMVTWLPVYHDMGLIGCMIGPLFAGTDCCMMSPLQFLQDPVKWLSAMTLHRATVTSAPNFAYELCLRKVTDAQLAMLDLSSLKAAVSGAEPVRRSTIERFAERFGPAGFEAKSLRPCYGLAEATLIVSGSRDEGPKYWSIDGKALLDRRVVPSTADDAYAVVGCGRPLGDLEVAIVDKERRRCAPDRVGEIWVRGKSVSAGYWRKPAETEATFGATLEDGTGPFLRTGDLGYLAPDGGLCIVGRLKDLIIVRGRNYYPQDIELTVEEASPRLRKGASAAFGTDNEGSGESVVVVVEANLKAEGGSSGWDEVVAAIQAAVGEKHELALSAVQLIAPGQLPKTPSGKVQRSETRRMFHAGEFEVVHSWVPPRTGLLPRTSLLPRMSLPPSRMSLPPRLSVPPTFDASTKVVVKEASGSKSAAEISAFIHGLLTETLGSPTTDDVPFFSLGLDSLELVGLTDALREFLNRPDLSTSAVVDFPTVGALSLHLAEQSVESADAGVVALDRTQAETGRVLSYWQEAVLAWEQKRPPSRTWTDMVSVRLRGPLQERKLEEAIRRVAERQDALCQLFLRDGTGAGKCDVLDLPFETIDVAGKSDAEVDEISQATASRPFAIDGTPLVRFYLLRRAADDHTFMITWHQLVHDGTGGTMVLKEILESYAARVENRAPSLPELPIRYADYAVWERAYFTGPGRRDLVAAMARLADAKPVELPTDRPRAGAAPGLLPVEPVGTEYMVGPDDAARFHELCLEQAITFHIGAVTVVGLMLARWVGTDEVVLTAPTTTRTRAELRSLFGRFGAWNPMRISLASDPTVAELFARVRAQVAFANTPVPGPLLYGSANVFDHPLNRVLVNTPFVERQGQDLPTSVAGLEVTLEPFWKPLARRNELAIACVKIQGMIVGQLSGCAALFDEATMQERAQELLDLFGKITADVRVSTLLKR